MAACRCAHKTPPPPPPPVPHCFATTNVLPWSKYGFGPPRSADATSRPWVSESAHKRNFASKPDRKLTANNHNAVKCYAQMMKATLSSDRPGPPGGARGGHQKNQLPEGGHGRRRPAPVRPPPLLAQSSTGTSTVVCFKKHTCTHKKHELRHQTSKIEHGLLVLVLAVRLERGAVAVHVQRAKRLEAVQHRYAVLVHRIFHVEGSWRFLAGR